MTLVTGSDCDLEVGGDSFVNVVQLFELAFDTQKLEYETLGGTRAASGSESGTLTITAAYDSGETDSLFDALWAAAGTTVAYVATVGTRTFTGNAVAVRPGAKAEAGAVSDFTVELTLDGIPTKAAVV